MHKTEADVQGTSNTYFNPILQIPFQKTDGRYKRIKPKNQTIDYQLTSLPPVLDGYFVKYAKLIKSLTMVSNDNWPYVFKRTRMYPSYREMRNTLVVWGNRKIRGDIVFDGDSDLHPYVLKPIKGVECNVDGMSINLDQENIPYGIIFTDNFGSFNLYEDKADLHRATVIVDDGGKLKPINCNLRGITFPRHEAPWSVAFLRNKVNVLGRTKIKTSAYELPGHVLGVAKNLSGAAVIRKWLESIKDSGVTLIRGWDEPGRKLIRLDNTIIEYVYEGGYSAGKGYLTDGTRTELLVNRYVDEAHPIVGGYPIKNDWHSVEWHDDYNVYVSNRAFRDLVPH